MDNLAKQLKELKLVQAAKNKKDDLNLIKVMVDFQNIAKKINPTTNKRYIQRPKTITKRGISPPINSSDINYLLKMITSKPEIKKKSPLKIQKKKKTSPKNLSDSIDKIIANKTIDLIKRGKILPPKGSLSALKYHQTYIKDPTEFYDFDIDEDEKQYNKEIKLKSFKKMLNDDKYIYDISNREFKLRKNVEKKNDKMYLKKLLEDLIIQGKVLPWNYSELSKRKDIYIDLRGHHHKVINELYKINLYPKEKYDNIDILQQEEQFDHLYGAGKFYAKMNDPHYIYDPIFQGFLLKKNIQ